MKFIVNKFIISIYFAIIHCKVLSVEPVEPIDLISLSLEELLNIPISVASTIASQESRQPASVSVIKHEQILGSGARTMNELLSIFVPGYFLVEDQDDTIAGFRGMVPDNNSKVMLLLDGQNINSDWFWGPSDAILNGLDLDFIERIEVIRGPGSVTLGQGALFGVINIVTRKVANESSAEIRLGTGKDNYSKLSLHLSLQAESFSSTLYLSKGEYAGTAIQNRGWPQAKNEQGLSVYERQHHLKRSDYKNALLKVNTNQLEASLFNFQQKRDLYNFFRDREVVAQKLQGANLKFKQKWNDKINLDISTYFHMDEYSLYSHGNNIESDNRLLYETTESGFNEFYNNNGLANATVTPNLNMGAVAEKRYGLKAILKLEDIIKDHNIAVGVENKTINSGLNQNNNNFIINEEIQLMGFSSDGSGGFLYEGSVNDHNTWVKRNSTNVSSLFVEDFIKINDSVEIFAAIRYDHHPNWGKKLTHRFGALWSTKSGDQFRLSLQTGFRGAVGVHYAGGFVQDGFLAESSFNSVNNISLSEVDFNWNGIAADDEKILSQVKPEELENLEFSWLTIPDKDQEFQLILFHNSLTNIISAMAHGYETLQFGDIVGNDQIGTWNGNWYYQNKAGEIQQWGIEAKYQLNYKALQFQLSHAYINNYNVDESAKGIYVLDNNHSAAYPENTSRFHLIWKSTDNLLISYNHLYYWNYYAVNGNKMKGDHLANLALQYQLKKSNFEISLEVKNIWDHNGLYPISGTGNVSEGDGTPAVEGRTWWLNLNYTY